MITLSTSFTDLRSGNIFADSWGAGTRRERGHRKGVYRRERTQMDGVPAEEEGVRKT